MQGYMKLGDPKYLRAVTNAVDMIWKDQSYATGGWGPNEAFVEPGKGQLGASLSETHRSFETPCGAYAHFKVMRYLMALTRDARYGDSIERVLYNTILGAWVPREDGSTFYYTDVHHSGTKTYRQGDPKAESRWDREPKWACCTGTLPQITADYTITAYFRAADGVYVNLYVPSRLTWTMQLRALCLTQQTAYPTESLVTMRMELSAPAEFALHLRIPAWAGRQTSISVNGKRTKADLSPGTFFALRRSWKSGDMIELDLDQPVRTEAVDAQNADQVAIMRGPQVLFAISEKQPEIARKQIAACNFEGREQRLDIERWGIEPAAAALPDIGNEVYQTYCKVLSA